MDIIVVISQIRLFVWYAIATVILAVIALMVARLILNKADLNPFSRPVIMLRRWTDPLVNPVRRVVITMGFGPNIAPLFVVLAALVLGYFASMFVGAVLDTVLVLVGSTLRAAPISFIGGLLYGLIAVYMLLIFARILYSWFANPNSRLLHFLIRATEPVLAPFRRVIPPVGMMDISPMIVMFLLDLLRRAVAATLIG
ncbi:MAG TPA: YggT family protein [Pyrinomonadaceae bacterium]|jgi:YggT family protein|nr:YggT family protein [Pyrinomonadaceae bacterium]